METTHAGAPAIAGRAPNGYTRRMRFSPWLVACILLMAEWCARGEAAKEPEKPVAGWALVPNAKTFRSAREIEYFLWDLKAGPGNEPVRSVELEIRQGDVRVALWPYAHELMLPPGVKDERKNREQGFRGGLPPELLRWMGELAAGEYELAFLVNGVRATNVAAFRIDPAFDVAKAPVFELAVLERPPLGDASRPLVWVTGPDPVDNRISTLTIYTAPWRVDGVERTRTSFVWSGPISLVMPGMRYAVVVDMKFFAPPVDGNAAHDYEFELAGHKSNSLRIDPQAAPLGAAWDAAAVQPGPEWPVSVRGVVTDAAGKPAEGYCVWLKTQVQAVAAAITDAQGAYKLPGNVRHGMYELAATKNKNAQPRFREVVAWQGETLVRDFDFRNPSTRESKQPPPVPKGKLAYHDLDKVASRLGKGLDVNARDENGNTALAMAITEKRFDLARKLVEAGAEVNTTRGDHTSILALAIIVADRSMVEFLLAKGADANRADGYDFTTPLMVAARRGSVELTELLLDRGAKVEGRSKEGRGAMEWAVRGGSPEVITLLARRGADANAINDDGNTPLMAAARSGNAATVAALIAAGADVNATNQDGWTPLGVTVFGQAQDGDYPAVAQALLAAGARINARTELGDTPVSQAAKAGRGDLLKVFAEAGAKLDPLDARDVIRAAVITKKYATLEALPKLGVNVNTPIDQGYTPLMYAVAIANDPKAVKALITAGADVNAPMMDFSGNVAPLSAAARYKSADVVRELIAAGAKLDTPSANGKTPLALALAEKNDAVVKVLKDAGAK